MDLNELEKLNDLKDKGVLTEEEFQKAKSKILNNNFHSSDKDNYVSQLNNYRTSKNEDKYDFFNSDPHRKVTKKDVKILLSITIVGTVALFILFFIYSAASDYFKNISPIWYYLIAIVIISIIIAIFTDTSIKCPKCGSHNIEVMGNDRKDFSIGKAVGGAFLAGGIGSLAGFAGKKGKYDVFCKECGTRWQTK